MKYIRWFRCAARPYRFRLAFIMICHVLIAGCALGFVYVSKKLVDVAVDVLSGGEPSETITIWACAMVGIVLIRILLNDGIQFLAVLLIDLYRQIHRNSVLL